ncbi:peptide chain release factor N(5)-glutamine methyltransferase [Frigidibacter sp. MR17.24]|uniref:peptide chain release factor N(5)-glutamine methyltransferase n=1 Tax=Frigidibacter sp. MR17.24 TaxID=3127345 RepID=UPI003012E28A
MIPARTAAQAIRAAIPGLSAAGIDDPMRDARRLMAHALGVAADRLSLHMAEPLAPVAAAAFAAAIEERLRRRPVAQITGERLFWGRSFRVTRDTLDPRPETEELVAEALAQPFGRVLDLGTGTGCILLTLLAERPEASGVGLDLSPGALAVAGENAGRLGLQARARLLQSDWYDAAGGTGPFDLIVSNPPYIAQDEMADLSPEVRDWEPAMALTPGGDGLDAYREIARGAAAHLAPGGRLIVEIGPTQGRAVSGLFRRAGLDVTRIRPDLDGRDRVVAARLT